MRTLNIPDTHGREIWKRAVQHIDWDEVVFIGDYFDSYDLSFITQLNNFEDILEFKEAHGDKVKLLIGNHIF